MANWVNFINGLIALVTTGVGAYAGASFLYGAHHFLKGDHDRGKSHMISALWGAGGVLTAQGLGTAIAALPH